MYPRAAWVINSLSVSGPQRGRAHVERDITVRGHMAELRPVNNTSNNEDKLADDEIELFNDDEELVWETNRKSRFEIIIEQPTKASNRKLPYGEVAPRPLVCYDCSKISLSCILL